MAANLISFPTKGRSLAKRERNPKLGIGTKLIISPFALPQAVQIINYTEIFLYITIFLIFAGCYIRLVLLYPLTRLSQSKFMDKRPNKLLE